MSPLYHPWENRQLILNSFPPCFLPFPPTLLRPWRTVSNAGPRKKKLWLHVSIKTCPSPFNSGQSAATNSGDSSYTTLLVVAAGTDSPPLVVAVPTVAMVFALPSPITGSVSGNSPKSAITGCGPCPSYCHAYSISGFACCPGHAYLRRCCHSSSYSRAYSIASG